MQADLPEEPDATANGWAVALAALAGWIVPVFILLRPPSDEQSGAMLCAGLVWLTLAVYASNRRAGWIVFLWIPLLACSALSLLMVPLSILGGSHGGPSAAPLEGVGMLMGLGAMLLFGFPGVLSLIWRPRSCPPFLLVALALANTIAIALATSHVTGQSTRQDIELHIQDKNYQPVSGASVRFERYGYGVNGAVVFDERGGPLVSDKNGVVTIPSYRMRYETRAAITKPGCRDILLTVGMQFDAHTDRCFVISTRYAGAIAQGHIPATNPMMMSLYLPPLTDAPDRSLKLLNLRSVADVGTSPARFLNLETGKFSSDHPSDLQLEVFFVQMGTYPQPRLRITGLNGTEVLQVSSEASLTGDISSYEQVFYIAPETGYLPETVVEKPLSSDAPTVYIRVRGGLFYARMRIELGFYNRQNQNATYDGKLYVNPSGSRRLE